MSLSAVQRILELEHFLKVEEARNKALEKRVIESEALFRKYIAYVRDTEGTDFVKDCNGYCIEEFFTDEEWKTLQLIARAS